MAIRRPTRVKLPESAYTPPEPPPLPLGLVELVDASWSCYSAAPVAFCASPGPGIVCTGCALLELGESWELLKERTNAGIPKAKFYRDLERAQFQVDPEYRRQFNRARA